jgi:NADP-dependent aldehyde dehydrogenase
VSSLLMGAGQFCTNPGLVLALEGPDLDRFIAAAAQALADMPASTMLTPGIHRAYETAVAQIAAHAAVTTAARGKAGSLHQCQPALFTTDASAFLRHPELQDEIFGAASLVVRCPDMAALRNIVETMEGQLTAALHIEPADYDAARSLLPVLERRVGRILVNGFGTGVEVGHAMVHGGPYPATADGRSTSVGSLAVDRFLRPVSYQDLPDAILPAALKADNPLQVNRRLDGALQLAR